LLFSFHPIFGILLEIAYLAMPVWAVLLAKQIGVFSRPKRSARSFKFIRAAHVWLFVAAFMLPVGFISMMILVVSSRVVPIQAGVDGSKLTSLWAPFILLNAGNAARVILQIATD
jgi:hypothetical protein